MSVPNEQPKPLKQQVSEAIAYMTGEVAKQKAVLFDFREQEDNARRQRHTAHEHLTGMLHRLDTLQGIAKEIEAAEKAGKPAPDAEVPAPVPAQEEGAVVPFDPAAAPETAANDVPPSEID